MVRSARRWRGMRVVGVERTPPSWIAGLPRATVATRGSARRPLSPQRRLRTSSQPPAGSGRRPPRSPAAHDATDGRACRRVGAHRKAAARMRVACGRRATGSRPGWRATWPARGRTHIACTIALPRGRGRHRRRIALAVGNRLRRARAQGGPTAATATVGESRSHRAATLLGRGVRHLRGGGRRSSSFETGDVVGRHGPPERDFARGHACPAVCFGRRTSASRGSDRAASGRPRAMGLTGSVCVCGGHDSHQRTHFNGGRAGAGLVRYRYWPVLATVSIERPASWPLPVTSVRM